MTIKILCECGTKFAFDIEPTGGKMPGAVSCPSCSRDATEAANEIISQQQMAAGTAAIALNPTGVPETPILQTSTSGPMKVAPPASEAPTMRVALPGSETAISASVGREAATEAAPGVEHCAKHPDAPAAANCVVCNKPICLDCMAIFGYLCSAYCKGLAARKNIQVPRYAGMRQELIHAETRKGNKVIATVMAAGVIFLGVFVWYNFFGAKPKVAWKAEASENGRYIYAQWLGKDKVIGVATDKAMLFEAGSGKVVWESAFKSDDKVERKARVQLQDEEADRFEYWNVNLRARVVGNDLWVIFPRRAVRIDAATGKRKQEVPLQEAADEATFSEAAYLGIAEPAEGRHLLTRIDLGSGQVQTVGITQAVTRVNYPARAGIPTAGSSTFSTPGRASDSFGSARLRDDRREFFLSGNSVVHLNVKLLEERFTTVQAMRERKGPSIIDSGTARASQGLEAAEEFFNDTRRAETGGVRLEDESRYMVTLRRPMGGGSVWSGEVVGPPAYFPMRNMDLLVAGKSIYALNKSGQKLWEGKITYPVAPRFTEGLTDDSPALEHGSRIYFFDQGNLIAFDAKNGQVAWRLQSVGISSVVADSSGKLYVSTTTAGPDQIKYSEEISITSKIRPSILKVDSATGAVLWQKDNLAQRAYVSGKYLYASDSRVSGIDRFSAITSGRDDDDAPVHSRVYRLDPDTGKEMWEYYRPKPPQIVEPRQNRILLQYGEDIRMIKYFSL
jgi:outer membrane protein assembly factor BamB